MVKMYSPPSKEYYLWGGECNSVFTVFTDQDVNCKTLIYITLMSPCTKC